MNCHCCGQAGVSANDANGTLARVWWCHTLTCPVRSFVAVEVQKPVEELVEEPWKKELWNAAWRGKGRGEAPKFKEGDMVDCQRWDATVKQSSKLGLQRVTAVMTTAGCDSGVVVKLEGYAGWLDQGWLKPSADKERQKP